MLQVGIIGAGIAGLSAAIAMSQAGHQVEVFERSCSRNDTGATIIIGPNGINILSHWYFDFDEASAVDCNRVMSTPFDTSNLDREERKQYSDRWCFLRRTHLHAGLRTVVERRWPNVKIKLGEVVNDVDVEAGAIHLTSGTKVRKDSRAIADGSHSKLITKILERPWPVDTSYVSPHRSSQLVAMVPDCLEPGKLSIGHPLRFNTCSKAEVGRTAHLLDAHPCRGGQLLVVSRAKETLPIVQSICEDLQDGKMHTNLSQDQDKAFTKVRTIVIGNAAHLVSPMHGQGTCMALEDVAALETLFADVKTLE